MSKRSKKDLEYDPDVEEERPKKKQKQSKVKPHTKEKAQTFLTTHAAEVVRMHKANMKPTAIAKTLCLSQGLRDGAVTGKQVSNWLNYHKKSKQIKTNSVSLKNNNLRVEGEDQGCVLNFYFIFFFLLLIFYLFHYFTPILFLF